MANIENNVNVQEDSIVPAVSNVETIESSKVSPTLEQNSSSSTVEQVPTSTAEIPHEFSSNQVEITPVGKLPAGVVIVIVGTTEGGVPHGTLLLCEYSKVGKDVLGFFRACKSANIHTVVSVGKRDPPFMSSLNDYLKAKQFKNVLEMDIPRCLHGKLNLGANSERDIMSTAGNAVCTHLDAGCNVLILSDVCQAGRLVACYSYGWTKCLAGIEELKEPLRAYVKAGADKKMLAAVKHYDYLRKYQEVQEWYLKARMDEMKKRNNGHLPNIESLSQQANNGSLSQQAFQQEQGPTPNGTVTIDSATEEVAAQVRAKSEETGLDTKEIIEKHVRKEEDKFVWINTPSE